MYGPFLASGPRGHPFSMYAPRGEGGFAKCVRSKGQFIVTVTSFCVPGGGGGSKRPIFCVHNKWMAPQLLCNSLERFSLFSPLLCYVVQQFSHQMAYAVHIRINFSAAHNKKRDAMQTLMAPIQGLLQISTTQKQWQKFIHGPMILWDTSFTAFMAIHSIVVIIIL